MTKKTKDSEPVIKKASSTKNTTVSKKKKTSTVKKTVAKKTTTKKTTVQKSSKTKKTVSSKKATKNSSVKTKKAVFQSEYYDLPYGYNKTVVKILAQTPTTLFVYWEISEDDRNKFKETYGENFFETTKPVLILYNDTLNYSFEIDINDFANSWYIHVNDSKCDYRVELGRKPISKAVSNNISNIENKPSAVQTNPAYIPYYVYITSSNKISAPNDRILFKPNQKIKFRNIKTNKIEEKDIQSFYFITNKGTITVQELYKYLYPNENFNNDDFLKNPSSGLTSSGSFSSQFILKPF
jgi:hypothetical protein